MNRGAALAVTCIAVVAATAWMGTIIAEDLSHLKRIESAIDEQESVKEKVSQERKRFRDDIDAIKRDLAAAPDSLKKVRSALLMEKSLDFAKMESILDQDEMRADKRLVFQREKKAAAMKHLTRWIVTLAVVDVVVAGVGISLARQSRKRGNVS